LTESGYSSIDQTLPGAKDQAIIRMIFGTQVQVMCKKDPGKLIYFPPPKLPFFPGEKLVLFVVVLSRGPCGTISRPKWATGVSIFISSSFSCMIQTYHIPYNGGYQI
jgi:hypothetical protein